MKKTCHKCGAQFTPRTDRPGKFCSITCYRTRSKVKSSCHLCGKEFFRAESKFKNSRSGYNFCSVECKSRAQKIGGLEEIMPPHYGTAKRPNYDRIVQSRVSCCGCGLKIPFLLQVHHIDGDSGNDSLSNLEVVCAMCHLLRHLHIKNGKWVQCLRSLTPREDLPALTELYKGSFSAVSSSGKDT